MNDLRQHNKVCVRGTHAVLAPLLRRDIVVQRRLPFPPASFLPAKTNGGKRKGKRD